MWACTVRGGAIKPPSGAEGEGFVINSKKKKKKRETPLLGTPKGENCEIDLHRGFDSFRVKIMEQRFHFFKCQHINL